MLLTCTPQGAWRESHYTIGILAAESAPAPRRVFSYLLVSPSYKFAPWHPGVLRQLPRDLLMLFPAIILRRCAVDKRIITRIEQALVRGVGLKAVADDLRENHLLHFHQMAVR